MFAMRLRKGIVKCEYYGLEDGILRDQLISGLNSRQIREKLLLAPELTFAKAVDIAERCEAAKKESIQYTRRNNGIDELYRIGINSGKESRLENKTKCWRCGWTHTKHSVPIAASR